VFIILDYATPKKGDKTFRILTVLDTESKRKKIEVKFLNEGIDVPLKSVLSLNQDEYVKLPKVDIQTDLGGNVVAISAKK